jgi:hypothetical protein
VENVYCTDAKIYLLKLKNRNSVDQIDILKSVQAKICPPKMLGYNILNLTQPAE